MWVQSYKTAASGVTGLLNNPFAKAAMLGLIGGAVATIAGRYLDFDTHYDSALKQSVANQPAQQKLFAGTLIGTGLGSVAGGLKAGAESDIPEFWDTGAGIGAAALGCGAGSLAAMSGDMLVIAAKSNAKVAAISVGVTAAVVGTGLVLGALDSNKPATIRVINRISTGHAVAPH